MGFVDPIYKYIDVTEEEMSLITSPHIRRLHFIKQKGLSYLFFPGAKHTRFDHTLGVLYLCDKIGRKCGLSASKLRHLRLAALFHDLGHGPYSHLTEKILWRSGWEVTHETISTLVIRESFTDVLSMEDLESITQIILGEYTDHRLSNILSGTIDADRIDYVFRDIYNSGLPFKIIRLDPLLNAIKITSDGICVELNSRLDYVEIEPILFLRDYMKWYIDKDVRCRALNSLVIKAIESMARSKSKNLFSDLRGAMKVNDLQDLPRIINLTDFELFLELTKGNKQCIQAADMIWKGQCHDFLWCILPKDINPKYQSIMANLPKIQIATLEEQIETFLQNKCGLQEGLAKNIIVDIPFFEVPKIAKAPDIIIDFPEYDLIPLPNYKIAKARRIQKAYTDMPVVHGLLERTKRELICVFCGIELGRPTRDAITAEFLDLLKSRNEKMDEIVGALK